MARVRLRPATLRDLDVLVLHCRKMWEDLGFTDKAKLKAHERSYRRWARQRLKSRRLIGWVAEAPGRGVVSSGLVWIRPVQPRPAWTRTEIPYLMSMYTEPEFRGRGLASRIIRESIRWCKGRGYPRVTLHAATDAIPLYGREGFERTTEMRVRLQRLRGG